MSFPDKFKKPKHFTAAKESTSVPSYLGCDPRLGMPRLKTQLTINGVPQEPVVRKTVLQGGFIVQDTDLKAKVTGKGIIAGVFGRRSQQFYDRLGREIVVSHEPNK